MTNDSDYFKNPAFGKVRAARVSGQATLFMVDYPQQHFIELEISTAELHRTLSNDWVHSREHLIRVQMSEVQWARLISGLNTEGTPCTLSRYHDPVTGEYKTPKLEDGHAGKRETFSSEIVKTANASAAKLDDAIQAVRQMLTASSLKKGDLAKVHSLMSSARGALACSIPFVVEQCEEALEKSVGAAKAEVDAHVEFTMMKLGERALGAAALQSGITNPTELGQALLGQPSELKVVDSK